MTTDPRLLVQGAAGLLRGAACQWDTPGSVALNRATTVDSPVTAVAIRVAQSELGVKVGVINPHPRDRRSRKLLGLNCLFYKQVPQAGSAPVAGTGAVASRRA